MSSESFNWRHLLGRWQEEWVPREDEDDDDEDDNDGGQNVVPPGRPGADEAAIAAAEERLGRRLPPSYREFLAVSDGWHVDQMAGVYQLGGVADIDWFRDPFDMTPLYEQNLGDNPREEDILLAGMWQRALRLETDSDISHALLDPGDSDRDGEWALYLYIPLCLGRGNHPRLLARPDRRGRRRTERANGSAQGVLARAQAP